MIEIMNLHKDMVKYPYDFRIDIRSPSGRAYYERHSDPCVNIACDQFEHEFEGRLAKESDFFAYIQEMLKAYRKHGQLRLFCWCAPKRCHGETIKNYIERKAAMPINEIRLIIAGGRDFTNYSMLAEKVDIARKQIAAKSTEPINIIIVSGTARGVDKLGEKYAEANRLQVDRYPADWDFHGKSAGYIRNKEMAQSADFLLAFWDGKSRGTAHMIETAKKLNIKVGVINYE